MAKIRGEKRGIRIPKKLLFPVAGVLRVQLKSLKKRRKSIIGEDPFKMGSREGNKASPDTDASEQFGHTRVSAVKAEIDRKIIQTRKALTRVKVGSYGICEECGELIDTDRLTIYPEATLCVKCEAKREKKRGGK